MIDHHQEEGHLTGATLGCKGTGAVAPLPALGFNEVNRDAAPSGDIGKMPPNLFGLMTEGDKEPPDAGIKQCADDSFRERQSEHSGQGFRCLGLRLKPRSQSGGQDQRHLRCYIAQVSVVHRPKLPRSHRTVSGSTLRSD